MRVRIAVLAGLMLLTGTINTIATKYQDIVVVDTGPSGEPLMFRHPAVQSACMFMGETLCLIPYFYMRWRRMRAKRADPDYVPMPHHEKVARRWRRIMAFVLPTLCDATGSSLMNIGLFYTYASIYQMLRGTLVLFAGMFTVLILRRQLYIHHWLGMVLITAGAALVGASSVIYAAADAAAAGGDGDGGGGGSAGFGGLMGAAAALLGLGSGGGGALAWASGSSIGASSGASGSLGRALRVAAAPQGTMQASGVWALSGGGPSAAVAPLFGDGLVVCAQMFTALQFILEEKFLVQYKVPALLAVGIEGVWGLLLCVVALPLLSIIPGRDGLPMDDALAAFRQIGANPDLAAAVGVSVLSIAAFNFTGISVTKSLSGAARATIDACRTLFIWLYCLHVGWERFHILQVLGFLVLIAGSGLYNELLKTCLPGGGDSSHRHRRSRQRSSRRRGDGSEEDEDVTAPLLPPGPAAGAHTAPLLMAAPGAGRLGGGARAIAARRMQAQAAVGQGSGGSDYYTMARSMRLGITTLSPHSLDSGIADLGSSYYGTTPGDGLGQLGDRSVTSSRAEGLAQLGDETEGELMRGDSVSSAASSMSSQPSTVQQ